MTTRNENMYAETGVTIRKPTESDIQGLAELLLRFYSLNEEFEPHLVVADNAKELSVEEARRIAQGSEGDMAFVAVMGSDVVGYVRIRLDENNMLHENKLAIITELYVRPEQRRYGIATSLVERVKQEVRRMGLSHVAVEFPASNYVAQDMYTKMGFRPYKVQYISEV